MDLSDFDALVSAQEEGVDVIIEHPHTGAPLDIVITVAGPDSKRAKDAQRKLLDRRLARRKSGTMTSTELEAMSLSAMVAAVIGWKGVKLDGKALDCTPENVRTVLERFPFIREQLDEVVADRTSFFARRSTNSATP